MTVGIVGLGLIGGSFAKAYHGQAIGSWPLIRISPFSTLPFFPARWTVFYRRKVFPPAT